MTTCLAITVTLLHSMLLSGPCALPKKIRNGREMGALHCFCFRRRQHQLRHWPVLEYCKLTHGGEMTSQNLWPPFCGYNLAWCVELRGEDLPCYPNKIKSVCSGKRLYDRSLIANKPFIGFWQPRKAGLNKHTGTYKGVFRWYHSNEHYKSFTYEMAAKTSWHRHGTKLRHCYPMYR